MKSLVIGLAATFCLSGTVFAETVIIPESRVSLYVGSFSNLEGELKAKIFEAAIEKCGSLKNSNIQETEIKLRIGNVFKFSLQGREDSIEGSYPQVSAITNITCYR